VDGDPVNIDDLPLQTYLHVGNFLVYRNDNTSTALGTPYNPCVIHGTEYHFSNIVVPSDLDAEFSGLLGNLNGDTTDDLLSREGEDLAEDFNRDSKLTISWHEHDEENPE
jgi:hypothetical protein